jgi:hypothetical protein
MVNALEFSHDGYLPSDLKEIEQSRLNLHFTISSWRAPETSDPDFTICGSIYQQTLLVYLGSSSAALPGSNTGDGTVRRYCYVPSELPVSKRVYSGKNALTSSYDRKHHERS